ncbi:MAG: hypothetical protein WAV41_05230 [Microgenomates group bacterium]
MDRLLEYDPEIHAGIIRYAGRDVLVEKCNAHMVPALPNQQQIISLTRSSIDFVSGSDQFDSTQYEPNELRRIIGGYEAGLKLLKPPEAK